MEKILTLRKKSFPPKAPIYNLLQVVMITRGVAQYGLENLFFYKSVYSWKGVEGEITIFSYGYLKVSFFRWMLWKFYVFMFTYILIISDWNFSESEFFIMVVS